MIDGLLEMVKHPFIDGFIFGPNDLSGSAGDFMNVFGEKTTKEITRAIEIIKSSGKRIGVACGYDRRTLEFWKKFDFDTVFAGADWNFIFETAKNTISLMRETWEK